MSHSTEPTSPLHAIPLTSHVKMRSQMCKLEKTWGLIIRTACWVQIQIRSQQKSHKERRASIGSILSRKWTQSSTEEICTSCATRDIQSTRMNWSEMNSKTPWPSQVSNGSENQESLSNSRHIATKHESCSERAMETVKHYRYTRSTKFSLMRSTSFRWRKSTFILENRS